MNVDRYMVNLFLEIRRNIPSSQSHRLKLADPNLGDAMVKLYRDTTDENIRLLTEIFLEKAGDDWLKKANPKKQAKSRKKPLIKEKKKAQKPKTPRYYRGVLVE